MLLAVSLSSIASALEFAIVDKGQGRRRQDSCAKVLIQYLFNMRLLRYVIYFGLISTPYLLSPIEPEKSVKIEYWGDSIHNTEQNTT